MLWDLQLAAFFAGCPAELWKITGFMDQLQHMRWNAQMAITTQQLLFHHHHCTEGKIISLFFLEEVHMEIDLRRKSNAVHLKHKIRHTLESQQNLWWQWRYLQYYECHVLWQDLRL